MCIKLHGHAVIQITIQNRTHSNPQSVKSSCICMGRMWLSRWLKTIKNDTIFNGMKGLIVKPNVNHDKNTFCLQIMWLLKKKISPDSAIYEFTFKLTFHPQLLGF